MSAERENRSRIGIAATVLIFLTGWALLAAGTHLEFNEFFGPVQP